MSSDSVCRICLINNMRMLSLIPLESVFEKVTNKPLCNTGKPLKACYICYAQLNNCYKFIMKSTQSDDILNQLLKITSEITPKSVAMIDREAKKLISTLTLTPIKHEDCIVAANVPIVIKSELLMQDEIDVKEEFHDTSQTEKEITDLESQDGGNHTDDVPLQLIKVEKTEDRGSSQAIENPNTVAGNQTPILLEEEEIKLAGPAKISKAQETEPNSKLKIRPRNIYECPLCKRRFKRNEQLINHKRTHTGEKPFQCNICESKFAHVASLKRHLMSHTGEKPHKCDICNRMFIQSSELKKHLRTHTGEKPYKCKVCESSFSLNKHLTSHMRVHTGEKPYACNICATSFRERSHLKRHIRVHSGEKPFECNVCERRFRRSCNLKSHLMIHTGDKPFKCKFCKNTFNRSTHLKLHIRTHTGIKQHECIICLGKFDNATNLQEHMKSHDKIETNIENSK